MAWRFYAGILMLALFWLLPAQLDAYITPATGCHHNGTWYADKSLVPTVEKCLNCQCNKKTLVCRLKVCPEMPMPPPRGCIVVQQKNTCCPYLSCARLDAYYKIPATRRIIAYLDHYERESIDRVVNENMLQRRSDDSDVDLFVCVKNGTVYKSGSAMSSSNLCTYCYCIGGAEKCVKPKCMLPVEGCKPIFVDSTCCPVRYDCTAKTSGKSSQEVRYRKTSNKHFLRMSQRLQRNRGCTVGQQFYVEGQKMKSDPDKPCDICFCIRGSRRCAPKKCSPALKNCMPVVPKGQCCPSSYDCGSQRDYRRAQNSRQLSNLFSLLFGKEDSKNATNIRAEYPPDRHPSVTVTHKQNILEKNDEKSILDTIREGLEIIDGNNEEMLAQGIDKLASETSQLANNAEEAAGVTSSTSASVSVEDTSTTEVNFLDLLLGSEEELASKVVEDIVPEVKTTPNYEGLSWVDLLLGPDEEDSRSRDTTVPDKLEPAESTTRYQQESTRASIDRIGDEVANDYGAEGEIIVGDSYETTWKNINLTTSGPQQQTIEANNTMQLIDQTTSTLKPLAEANTAEVAKKPTDLDTKFVSTIKPKRQTLATTKAPEKNTTTRTISTSTTSTTPATTTTVQTTPPHSPTIRATKAPIENIEKPASIPLKENKLPSRKNTTKTPTIAPTKKPTPKPNDLLSAFLDGISDILKVEKKTNNTLPKPLTNKTQVTNKLASTTTTKTPLKPHNLPTPKPLPSFKPLPTQKPHTRINSKIANLTVAPNIVPMAGSNTTHNITFKPLPADLTKLPLLVSTTSLPTSTERATTTIPTKHKISISTEAAPTTTTTTATTVKPLVIKTNPTILEAEPFENSAEPTLPPSLPNLKIIPFLPTDAVKADKPLYDFYHSQTPAVARVDYDLYEDPNLYPAITERYPLYPDLEDASKAEYIYKFNVEGPPAAVVSSTVGQLDGAAVPSTYVKYDFVDGSVPHKGFSPPTKTEGGFVPKAPLIIDDNEETLNGVELQLQESNYQQVTKHIVDITTSAPGHENTTRLIEITTPDPFKDVIHTEPPPDLTSLIEDKENILESKHQQEIEQATKIVTIGKMPVIQKDTDIVHITTAEPEAFNNSHVDAIAKSPAHNKTEIDNVAAMAQKQQQQQHKNTIETFLDLLLGDEEETVPFASPLSTSSTPPPISSSTVPPFKTLPATAIKQLTTKHTQTTTTANNSRINTTTPNPAAVTTTTTSTSVNTKTNATTTRTKSKTRHPTHRNNTITAAQATAKTVTATPRPKTTKPKVNTTRRAQNKTAHNSNRRRVSTTTLASTITTSPPTTTTTRVSIPISTVTNPFMMSPFDKLPFMDASFEVKRSTTSPPLPPPTTSQTQADDFLLQYKNSLNKFEGLEPAYESFFSSTTTSTNAPPLAQRNVEQLAAASTSTGGTSTEGAPQQSPSNSLIDPSGVLKLAGCNIYGRMYRVGRIILELSSPCLECKCTEVGVKCGQLDC